MPVAARHVPPFQGVPLPKWNGQNTEIEPVKPSVPLKRQKHIPMQKVGGTDRQENEKTTDT